MFRKMKTLMYGTPQDCRTASEVLDMLQDHTHEYCQVSDLEEFNRMLVDWQPTLVLVLADGAEGMECVYRTRERGPSLPVFWFSDDRGFGVLSYRLNCAYFSTKPITPEKIAQAIQRCNHCGIQYCTA